MLLHHVELWVPDLTRAERSWGWLLTALGAQPYQAWDHGRSWRDGDLYVVLGPVQRLAASLRVVRGTGSFCWRSTSRPATWTSWWPRRRPTGGGCS
jgi:hypothetical protein